MKTTVKVVLGPFARMGVESYLGSDLATGVRIALAEYVSWIDSGVRSIRLPRFGQGSGEPVAATALDLAVDARTLEVLEGEAARQSATVGEIATHSVLLYLAELDRLTPSGSSHAA